MKQCIKVVKETIKGVVKNETIKLNPKKMIPGERYEVDYKGKRYCFIKMAKNVIDMYEIEEIKKEEQSDVQEIE